MKSDTAFETITPELEEVLVPYLSHRYTKGQFDRCTGYTQTEAKKRAHTILAEYIRDQQGKWDELGPLVESCLGRKPGTILDVGSSIGQAAYMLSQRYPQAKIVGCEVEPEAIAVANRLTLERGNCTYVHSGIEELKSPNGSFDFIHCANVLEHVVSPPLAIRRMVDLLAPGGVISLHCPNYLFPYEGHVQCWMLPGGPRVFVKLRLLLRRQDPAFIDDVRLEVNIVRVKRWLKSAGKVELTDLNHAKIDSILLSDKQDGLRAPGLVSWIKRLHLAHAAAWMLRTLPIAPSVALLIRKAD